MSYLVLIILVVVVIGVLFGISLVKAADDPDD